MDYNVLCSLDLTRKEIITAATNKGYLWATRNATDSSIENQVKFCRTPSTSMQKLKSIVQWLESRGFKIRSTGTTERTSYVLTTCGVYIDERGHCHNTLAVKPRKCSTCESFDNSANNAEAESRCKLLLVECWPDECCECWR